MQTKGTRLVKRENGIFYIAWRGSSRGKTTGTKDLDVAQTALANFILNPSGKEKLAVGLTVHQAIDDYIAEHVAPNVISKDITRYAGDYFKAYFTARKRVIDVSEEDIEGYKGARRNGRVVLKRENPKPASDATLRRELGMLNATFNHAVRRKRISPERVPHIAMPAEPPPKYRWLTKVEESQLVAACPVDEADEMRRRSENIRCAVAARNGRADGQSRGAVRKQPSSAKKPRLTRIYRFLILALDTGARKRALETLTWPQVDFATNTINLNPAGRVQTKKRRAIVPMSPRLRGVMERAYREKKGSYVLDHPGNGRTSFEHLVLRARLDDVTPHTLRHTWATRAAQAGVSMRDIADFLGDDMRTVERVYRHHHPDFLRKAANWREREQASSTKADDEEDSE